MGLAGGYGIKAFFLVGLLALLLREANGASRRTPVSGGSAVFDVTNYGAKPDGRSESAQAFIKAWNAACKSGSAAQVLIPEGNFMAGEVVFQGPCNAPITVLIKGTVLAQTDLSTFTTGVWFSIEHVDGVTITGGGTLNGQGQTAYKYGKCKGNCDGALLPVTVVFMRSTNVEMYDITSVNSKGYHMKVNGCTGANLHDLTITAPNNSPNTDGVHVSDSNNVNITNTVIGTGDDCISIGETNTNIFVSGITCGPGHGISIGSLGKRDDDTDVKGVRVTNCTLISTTNGARIKTYQNSPKLQVSDVIYEDIIFKNVSNPIIIDQHYGSKSKSGASNVKITDTHFRNIKGTTPSKIAINLMCSSAVPCEDIELSDINIIPVNPSVPPTSACDNVKPTFSGTENPSAC